MPTAHETRLVWAREHESTGVSASGVKERSLLAAPCSPLQVAGTCRGGSAGKGRSQIPPVWIAQGSSSRGRSRRRALNTPAWPYPAAGGWHPQKGAFWPRACAPSSPEPGRRPLAFAPPLEECPERARHAGAANASPRTRPPDPCPRTRCRSPALSPSSPIKNSSPGFFPSGAGGWQLQEVGHLGTKVRRHLPGQGRASSVTHREGCATARDCPPRARIPEEFLAALRAAEAE